jgi:hypothetical protein
MHVTAWPSGWAPLLCQDRWLLLQGLLQLSMAHLPRVGEWAAAGKAVMDA